MPAPQLVPPGHLEQHVVLVALTPALLAMFGGIAAAICPPGRGRMWLAAATLILSLGLLILFLRPNGVCAAFTEPLEFGFVRVGSWQVAGAILAALWAAVVWRPWTIAAHASATWCWRVAIAMALPMCVVPIILLIIEADLRRGDQQLHHQVRQQNGRRWIRPTLAILAMVAAALHLIGAPAAMAVACGITALLSAPAWRVPLLIAAAAAMTPLGGWMMKNG